MILLRSTIITFSILLTSNVYTKSIKGRSSSHLLNAIKNDLLDITNDLSDISQYNNDVNADAVDDFCIDQPSGLYLEIDRCHGFIQCSHGQTFHQPCPGDLNFDPVLKICNRVECVCQGGSCTTDGNAGNSCSSITPTTGFCPVEVQSSDTSCQKERENDVNEARMWYEPTAPGVLKKTAFPLPIPWLNQPEATLQFHSATDRDENHWASVFSVMRSAVGGIDAHVKGTQGQNTFFTYEDYKNVYRAFNLGVKELQRGDGVRYYGNPAFNRTLGLKVVEKDFWLTDEFFEQKRLAGPCPFQLKRVTRKDKRGIHISTLMGLLNANFAWESELSNVHGSSITFDQAVDDGTLYVVYHPEFNGIPTMPDMLDINPYDTRKQKPMTSPIAVFIQHRETKELKVVAIQMDYKPDSPVFTPSSGLDWLVAKGMVESVDTNICQAMNHLSHIHLTSTIYCLLFRRHFSKKHPLFDVMKNHCEGTTPHIAMSWPVLSTENQAGHLLTGMGHLGFVNLSMQAYETHHYGMLDYENLLRSNGLLNDNLIYHPFRDDGKEIWDMLGSFTKNFVNNYYADDNAVANDKELQMFANEVSADGDLTVSDDAKKGQIKGFPSSFKTIRSLRQFIKSFLWLNIFHAAVNYPVEPYNSYMPIAPTKFYDDTSPEANDNYAHVLPDAPTTIGVSTFSTVLGNVRINRLFDYHERVKDQKLQRLVKKTYQQFHDCLQKKLEKRNADRLANDLLPFEYFEPKWIPNSIHV